MLISEAEARAEARHEAAPAALVTLLVFVALAVVSWAEGWDLLGLPWWVWLLVAVPVVLLAIDVSMSYRGAGLVRSREAALALLGLLFVGNVTALGILVVGLVTTRAADLGGGELLLTGFAIWSANVMLFALASGRETRAGLPAACVRLLAWRRTSSSRRIKMGSPTTRSGDRRCGITSTSR